ncbi:type II toxin-antitoxin system VapC family toxin [Rhizobium sp. LjRoot254]|uniref:type II toxin-antitoxin system VapC family toxin n=1 Tax=Rhizobium sp. LjRoot254 TaxID=3342297 RepID=UPI003ECD87B8
MSERRFLVDTHILIWAMEGDAKLPGKYQQIVADGSLIYVSIVSLWEIAIKTSIGKLEIQADVIETLREYDIEILPMTVSHIEAVRTLPHHHRDPFDRMLIAQAMTEDLSLLTVDRHFALYGVTIA